MDPWHFSWCCHELWGRFQVWLRSDIAVVVALVGNCNSDSTPGLRTSICHGWGPKKTPKYIFLGILKYIKTNVYSDELLKQRV